ncbi:amidohydrolase [Kribbella sp. GL6]|uniref:amidohydrolase n=1 Tax=Kribbella sp. GL6 TaxID=3419765 RepID=UPI003D0507FD
MLDLRIEDAVVITMDDEHPLAHTIGIWNGRIVGVDDAVRDLPAREVRRLNGATVLPGFIDAHTHLAWAGRAERSLDLSGVRTKAELLETVARHIAGQETGTDWLDIAGYDATAGFDLCAADLDTVTGARPTYVVDRSGHAAVVNSAALQRITERGVTLDQTNGRLFENAHTAFRQQVRLPYSIDEISTAIAAAAKVCVEQGVTTCSEAGISGGMAGSSPVELLAYQHALRNGRLPIRVQALVGNEALPALSGAPEDRISLGLDLGVATGLGDDRLWIGPLKIWLDGGIQARTAALSEPFVGTANTGELAGDPAELTDRIVAAHESGWQLALHAIGDRAVDLAIDALEACQAALPRPDAVHRIEHCGLVRPDQLARLAACGAMAVIQPEFMWAHGSAYAEVLGPIRTHWQYRGRSLLDAGVPVVGSSDRPVVGGAPLRAIQFMVTREDEQGATIGHGEQLTVDEALRAYTVEAARAVGKPGRLGVLRSGAEADLVVLADDPRTVPADRIADIVVLQTIVAGEVVS